MAPVRFVAEIGAEGAFVVVVLWKNECIDMLSSEGNKM